MIRSILIILFLALAPATFAQDCYVRFAKATDETKDTGKALADAIDKNPVLIDRWKLLDDTGIPGVADNVDNVKFVDDYLTKNPGKDPADVTLDIQTKGWDGWVDEVGKGAGNWVTYIGKNIDKLVEAPVGYQFYNYNGKKFLRRIDASDINNPRLTVKEGNIVKYDGETITKLSTSQINDLAISATKNPTSSKGMMLGKYDSDLTKVSYNRSAGKEFTYFEMDNWDGIFKLVDESRDEMWKINEYLIKIQFNANKRFYFSHNPNDINIIGVGSFYEQEIELLKHLVSQKYNKTAKFIASNQYWELAW